MTILSPQYQHSPPANWQQQLKLLCQRTITAQERHDYIIFLREKLCLNNEQPHHKTGITNLPTTTILLLIKACQHLRDWPLIIHCCEEYQTRLENTLANGKPHQQSIHTLRVLSQAYQQLGLFDAAEQTLQRMMRHAHYHPLMDDCQNLQQNLKQWAKTLPKGQDDLRSDLLLLTPLQTYHENDFLWQYADPSISQLCNLPDFDQNNANWQQWLRTSQQESTALFAINHLYWGFIGSVGLSVSRGIGFFYYWLGNNFQGHGFGPQAVTVMLTWAQRHLRLRRCYAKAYQDNLPSKKAMTKIGFRLLSGKVIVPNTPNKKKYEEELFYWGDSQDERVSLAEINRFFIHRGFEERVLPLTSQHRNIPA